VLREAMPRERVEEEKVTVAEAMAATAVVAVLRLVVARSNTADIPCSSQRHSR
jgi:hypothetical protein